MAVCLVTTLKEPVTDTSLLKLDEFSCKVIAVSTFHFVIGVDAPITLTIKGDGYFTDSTGTSNYGKTISVPVDGYNQIYSSTGAYNIVFSGKSNITRWDIYSIGNGNAMYTNVNDLKYCTKIIYFLEGAPSEVTGDLEDFSLMTNLNLINCYNFGKPGITGDLKSLENLPLTELLLGQNERITGNISSIAGKNLTVLSLVGDSKIAGNLSSLPSTLVGVDISSTQITGNLSSLSTMTNLVGLHINNTSIAGDTSSLAPLTNLTTFNYTNCPNITGTWPLV